MNARRYMIAALLLPLYLIAALVAFLVSGCAYIQAHTITLMSRTDGTMGTGNSSGFGYSGDISITIPPRVYRGRWVAASEGSTTDFGTVPFLTATTTGGSSGNALLRSDDGGTLRCTFRFNKVGIGVCQDGDGKIYDTQIN
jgi:hypothetical protein